MKFEQSLKIYILRKIIGTRSEYFSDRVTNSKLIIHNIRKRNKKQEEKKRMKRTNQRGLDDLRPYLPFSQNLLLNEI